jgi:hypothetical protein
MGGAYLYSLVAPRLLGFSGDNSIVITVNIKQASAREPFIGYVSLSVPE